MTELNHYAWYGSEIERVAKKHWVYPNAVWNEAGKLLARMRTTSVRLSRDEATRVVETAGVLVKARGKNGRLLPWPYSTTSAASEMTIKVGESNAT